MKIKISIHALLVQASKLNCYWDIFNENLRYIQGITNLGVDIRDIVHTIPSIEAADFSYFYTLRHRSVELSTFSGYELYLRFFLSCAPPHRIESLLKNMLKVVPNGEIIIELTPPEFSIFNTLIDSRLKSSTYLHEEYMNMDYQSYTVVEE